ncbi:ATP-binding cassette domain-containing protein, partial [Micromonospora sp. DH15]|nr:ATP-binding cassette domain-containing protein [Micromonospora sp. DH15]
LDATGEKPDGDVPADPADPSPASLAFADVGFAYEPAVAPLPGAEVLGEVSFTGPAGKTVALVGSTGSGKSTIAALAVRLVDPHTGTVSLDGVDVRRLTAASLAGTAALVAQVPFVFDDTVRANIALDRPGVTDDDVWAALRLAE